MMTYLFLDLMQMTSEDLFGELQMDTPTESAFVAELGGEISSDYMVSLPVNALHGHSILIW